MKRCIVMLLPVLLLVGCNALQTPSGIQLLTDKVVKLSDKVDAYQEITQTTFDQLESDEIIDAKTVVKVKEANAYLDGVQEKLVELVQAAKNAEYSGGDSLTTGIEMAKPVIQASASWNPYATLMIGILGLIETATLVFAKKKIDENKKANEEVDKISLKYQAHKQGEERFRIKNEPNLSLELYDDIGNARNRLGVK